MTAANGYKECRLEECGDYRTPIAKVTPGQRSEELLGDGGRLASKNAALDQRREKRLLKEVSSKSDQMWNQVEVL